MIWLWLWCYNKLCAANTWVESYTGSVNTVLFVLVCVIHWTVVYTLWFINGKLWNKVFIMIIFYYCIVGDFSKPLSVTSGSPAVVQVSWLVGWLFGIHFLPSGWDSCTSSLLHDGYVGKDTKISQSFHIYEKSNKGREGVLGLVVCGN